MRRPKLLTQKDIEEARRLRREKKLGKRRLAMIFHVSPTTIWENVYVISYRRPKRKKKPASEGYSKDTKKCPKCDKFITRHIQGNAIPVNFNAMDMCISCYLRGVGLTYMDLL